MSNKEMFHFPPKCTILHSSDISRIKILSFGEIFSTGPNFSPQAPPLTTAVWTKKEHNKNNTERNTKNKS